MKISRLAVLLVCAAFSLSLSGKAFAWGNPYLPFYEHIPDGEPRVFEDPDNPGKYRVYIIGSHDVRFDSYCGPDIRQWSAPIEDLTRWTDEGSIFTYPVDGQWDVMYAPDLVEVNRPDGTREYYLYPNCRGRNRGAIVCKSDRPDGPFKAINVTEDGRSALPGSIIGYDPAVFIDPVTDPSDPDFKYGFRAYAYWGFGQSSAAQLDQTTMWSLRPGTEIIHNFLPGMQRPPRPGQPEMPKPEYKYVYPGEDLDIFNFFEASSIRKVGNKYVSVYSGYSGPEYGMEFCNATLRYAYADTPLGPWKNGGVLVDARGPVVNEDGTAIVGGYSNHNTHGSLQKVGDQWYVFYHRCPRGYGFARQSMVAPVHINADEASVADGGRIVIRGFDPYSDDNTWTAKAVNGMEYTGAEVTSEGFQIYGLPPYQYYSAGYACYLSDKSIQSDTWEIWNNDMPLVDAKSGDVIGYKYFGFGGLDKASKGVKPFKGTGKRNRTAFNLFLASKTETSFKVNVWMDGSVDNGVWKGIKLGEIIVPAGSAGNVRRYVLDVAGIVDGIGGKHSIFLVPEGGEGPLCDISGLGFSSRKDKIDRPVTPKVDIKVNGMSIDLPEFPTRSTDSNGITGYNLYDVDCAVSGTPVVTASCDNKAVKTSVTTASDSEVSVNCDYNGVVKTYRLHFK